jgi:hypothetical protein
MTTRKSKPAAKPGRKAPAAVKAAADRAEARSAGKPITEPNVSIDPGPAREAEAAKKAKRAYIAKSRMAYSEALGLEICARMVTRGPTGRVQSLTEVCAAPDMPCEESVRRWRREHPAFAAAYAEAREERAGMLGDEIIEISDSTDDPQRVRNRVSARQWYAARINRREFGEASVHAVSLMPAMDDEGGSDRDLARRVALVLQEMLARRQAKRLIEAQPIDDVDG